MKYFFSLLLAFNALIAFMLSLQFFWSKERRYKENRTLALFSLSSGIWSIGFSLLFIQEDVHYAYICRSIGIFGTILYMITVLNLICQFSGISDTWKNLFLRISYSGMLIYLLAIQPGQTSYVMSRFGMTYQFAPGLTNLLYTGYFLLVSVCILALIIYCIRFSSFKRIRSFGWRFLAVAILILIGTVLDMVFPALGLPALPGSNVTQFWGLVIIHYAMLIIRRSRITVENMSQFIYDSLAMPVLVYDASFRLQIVNDAGAGFFSIYPVNQEYRVPIHQLFPLSEQTVFGYEADHASIDAVCKKNDTYCNLAISKIRDRYGDVIGYILLVTDLSERQSYIRRLQEAKREADASNQAKSAFLANMSHEIRTPMNAIIGFSELALKEPLAPQVKEYLTDIKTSSHNLLSIINDILDISKIESGKMELICDDYDTGTLFRDIFILIKAQAEKKNLSFEMSITQDMPSRLYGDTTRVRSILINLLNNAVKYTHAGSIRMNVRVNSCVEDICTLQFDITDTGMGIRREDMATLFDSFSQVDQKTNHGIEGTGLGLAMVKGFCMLMDGTVTVDSTYGKGSTFTAVIKQKIVDPTPMEQSGVSSAEDKKDAFSLGSMRITDTTILVVDDNPVNLKVISHSLHYYGLTVDTASSGKEALELCAQKQYTIVFMDQMMPRMDGVETMRRLRAMGGHYAPDGGARIVVLTANAISGVRDELLAQGFDEYLSKPINYEEMERIFETFLPPEHLHREENTEAETLTTAPSSVSEASAGLAALTTSATASRREPEAPVINNTGQRVISEVAGNNDRRLESVIASDTDQRPEAAVTMGDDQKQKRAVAMDTKQQPENGMAMDAKQQLENGMAMDAKQQLENGMAMDTDRQLLKASLPELDLNVGLSCCGGHMEDYLDILDTVCQSGEQQLTELITLWHQCNYKDFTILSHALKGSCQNIGATALAEQARAMELAGKRDDIGYIDTHVEDFMEDYRSLLTHISAVLKKGSKSPDDIDAMTLIKDLSSALDNFDFATADKLCRQGLEASLTESEHELFLKIAPLLDEIETDAIQELIRQFL